MSDTFQWERNSGSGFVDIGGATSASYVLVTADVGHTIRARAYRDAVLVGESNIIGPIAAIGDDPSFTLRYFGSAPDLGYYETS